jgi:hypothetical protein
VSPRQFTVLAGVTVSCLWPLTAPVAAATPGVHVDPGSPSGSEYAVPLVAARGDYDKPSKKTTQSSGSSQPSQSSQSSQQSSQSSQQSSQSSQSQPATFGAGITPAHTKARRPARAPQHVPKPDVTRPVAVDAKPGLRDVDADSTVSPTAVTGGIVAGMLLIALAVAAVARQPRRTSA